MLYPLAQCLSYKGIAELSEGNQSAVILFNQRHTGLSLRSALDRSINGYCGFEINILIHTCLAEQLEGRGLAVVGIVIHDSNFSGYYLWFQLLAAMPN